MIFAQRMKATQQQAQSEDPEAQEMRRKVAEYKQGAEDVSRLSFLLSLSLALGGTFVLRAEFTPHLSLLL